MISQVFQGLFRSVLRNKTLTAINLSGLALGFSSCILIALFLFDEVGYDRHQANLDRIYRITTKFISAGSVDNIAISASPLPELLKESFPEVEESIRVNEWGAGATIRTNSEIFQEDNVYSADPGILRVFSYTFISGNPATSLLQPNSVVLTQSQAKKYFPSNDALGKILRIEDKDHEVTGVIEDVPLNSEIWFTVLVPLDTSNHKDWFDFSHYIFVQFDKNSMKDPSFISSFQKKLDKITDDRINAAMQKENATLSASMTIQPLKGMHFDNSFTYDTPKGNKDYVYIFVSVAILILFIACINYINFSIVQSMEKSREVGIRKVIGSTFMQLVIRYIVQSIILTFVALIFSIVLVYLLLPLFNDVVGRNFSLLDLFRFEIIVAIAATMLITGVLAGSYPAFYSSSLKIVSALKGEVATPAGRSIRKLSITIQFAVTLGLLISTSVIFSQMEFVRNYNLGFNKDNVLAIRTPEDSLHYQAVVSFKNELALNNRIVKSISLVGDGGMPGDPDDEQRGSHALKNAEGKEEVHMINNTYMDEHYFEALGIEMKLGRNYNGSVNDKENSIIVNEALVKALGWKDPLSQTVHWGKDRTIIGVVGDIHYKSLYNPVQPQYFVPHQFRIVNVMARLNESEPEDLNEIQQVWRKHFPDEPFRYRFLDETLQKQYKQEKTATSILTYFSGLTIAISVFGMFGLSLLSAVQRKKEIGIRKVIGAEFKDIAVLFSKEYFLLILIALVLASPVVWYLMNEWLSGFITHTPLEVYIFFLVGFLFSVVALVSVLLSIGKITRVKSVDLMK